MNIDESKLISGVKRSNKSLKIYKTDSNEYWGIEKKYIFGICYSKKQLTFKGKYDANDHVIDFKGESRF